MSLMNEISFLGMDYGASSIRGMLGSFDGKSLRLRELKRFPNSALRTSHEFLHWDKDTLLDALKLCLSEAKKQGVAIKSVGVNTWAQDFGVIDGTGKVEGNPFCYRSPAYDESIGLLEKIISPRDIFARTGVIASPVSALCQIVTLKRLFPDLLEKKSILFIAGLLGYMLTGEKHCDISAASISLLYDNKNDAWRDDILSLFHIEKELLPDMLPHCKELGYIRDKDLCEIGYAKTPVVSVVQHDTASAFSAVDMLSGEKDTVYISCGTWAVIALPEDGVVLSEQTFDFSLSNEKGLFGRNFLCKNLTGMWIEQECMRDWRKKGKKLSYRALDAFVMNSGADAFIDTQADVFKQPGDMPSKIVRYCQSTGQKIPDSEYEIYAVLMHSFARDFAKEIQRMLKFAAGKINRLRVIGGGAKNIPLCRLLEKHTGLETVTGPVEAAVTGNILSQMMAAGEIKDPAQIKDLPVCG